MEDIFETVSSWINSGKSAAFGTVISRQGSAPREVGAKMAVSSQMQIVGSVSSGCVEGATAELAIKTMKSGSAEVVEYGITDDVAWSVGLTCGGRIRVLVQPIREELQEGFNFALLNEVIKKGKAGETFSSLTGISSSILGKMCLASSGKVISSGGTDVNWVSADLLELTQKMEEKRQPGVLTIQDQEYFVDVFAPPARIVIIGAVHVAIPLVEMAKVLGFETVVIDPRAVFANEERFPHTDRLIKDWPTAGMEAIQFSKDDYLLVLSHDDKLDLPVLTLGIEKKARYIGMLSSRASRDERYQELAASGVAQEELQKIYSPVGLDIGSKTPEEIALAILAEITAVKNGKSPTR